MRIVIASPLALLFIVRERVYTWLAYFEGIFQLSPDRNTL